MSGSSLLLFRSRHKNQWNQDLFVNLHFKIKAAHGALFRVTRDL